MQVRKEKCFHRRQNYGYDTGGQRFQQTPSVGRRQQGKEEKQKERTGARVREDGDQCGPRRVDGMDEDYKNFRGPSPVPEEQHYGHGKGEVESYDYVSGRRIPSGIGRAEPHGEQCRNCQEYTRGSEPALDAPALLGRRRRATMEEFLLTAQRAKKPHCVTSPVSAHYYAIPAVFASVIARLSADRVVTSAAPQSRYRLNWVACCRGRSVIKIIRRRRDFAEDRNQGGCNERLESVEWAIGLHLGCDLQES